MMLIGDKLVRTIVDVIKLTHHHLLCDMVLGTTGKK